MLHWFLPDSIHGFTLTCLIPPAPTLQRQSNSALALAGRKNALAQKLELDSYSDVNASMTQSRPRLNLKEPRRREGGMGLIIWLFATVFSRKAQMGKQKKNPQ